MAESRLRTMTTVVWLALIAVAGVMLAAAGFPVVKTGVVAVAVTAAQLVTVPAPSGQKIHLALGAGVAAGLLIEEPLVVGSGVALGMAVAWAISASRGRVETLATDFIPEVGALGALVIVFYSSLALSGESWPQHLPELVAVVAGGLAWYLGRAVMRALVGLERAELSSRYVWLLALDDWTVMVSILAAGALFGLTFPEMRWWAIPVAAMPYAFSHLAFVRYDDTRTTYRQTIRALAQIPEVAGLASEGHAGRTAELAVSVAREAGVHPRRIADLEYASLMHDIGRITLNEPAILRAGYTDEDIARWGAQIIAEAPYLERVATLVADKHRPYRTPGVERDPEVSLSSKIIKVAAAYDKAVHEFNLSPVEALEQLHRGSAYEYDPVVTASLRRVLVHRGAVSF